MHGFLVLDKPTGITSAQAVAQVKRHLGCRKIGHGGTLDPLASGVLPLAINEATKAFEYVASSLKEYRFTITFGEERDTDDAEGKVIATTDVVPTREQLLDALPAFTGTILQTPPIYSALKIDGERSYKRARAGEEVKMQARPVDIHSLTLEAAGGREATLAVTCGKGTYVRSLAKDIARKCNSLGYISMLRRTRVGVFHEARAISLEKLPSLVHNPASFEAWVPIELALDDIPAINLDPLQETRLRYGQSISAQAPDGKAIALHQGRIVAMGECGQGTFKPQRVFNLT